MTKGDTYPEPDHVETVKEKQERKHQRNAELREKEAEYLAEPMTLKRWVEEIHLPVQLALKTNSEAHPLTDKERLGDYARGVLSQIESYRPLYDKWMREQRAKKEVQL